MSKRKQKIGKLKSKKGQNNSDTTETEVITKKKIKKFQYTQEAVQLALVEILRGDSIASVSRKYHIPESTLRDKKKGTYNNKKPGPSTVLTRQEEENLIQWFLESSKKGITICKSLLLDSVQLLCDIDNRKTPFSHNRPGRSWYEGFLNRHRDLIKIMSINTKPADDLHPLTESKIRAWFLKITSHLSDNNILAIHPSRIFNLDDTKLPLNIQSPATFTPRGSKTTSADDNVTVMICCNAEGILAPSLILFTGQTVCQDVVHFAPANMSFDCSKSGSVTDKNFYNYIAEVFYPWVKESNIEFPVILYIDCHKTHLTYSVSKFCEENQIFIIPLPSDSTHIIQPLDDTFFFSLKQMWETTNKNFCRNCAIREVKECQFSIILQKTYDNLSMEYVFKNAFRKCGLCPVDVDAIDFSEVFKGDDTENSSQNDANSQVSIKQELSLDNFEKYLDKQTIKLFHKNDGPVWKGRIEDTSLFNLWYKLYQSDQLDTPYINCDSFLEQGNLLGVTPETVDCTN